MEHFNFSSHSKSTFLFQNRSSEARLTIRWRDKPTNSTRTEQHLADGGPSCGSAHYCQRKKQWKKKEENRVKEFENGQKELLYTV